jgi:hypothetical protein
MSDVATAELEVIEVELDTVQLLALALPTDENGQVGFNPYDTGAFRALGWASKPSGAKPKRKFAHRQ